jgi:hypothetical protein
VSPSHRDAVTSWRRRVDGSLGVTPPIHLDCGVHEQKLVLRAVCLICCNYSPRSRNMLVLAIFSKCQCGSCMGVEDEAASQRPIEEIATSERLR